MRNLAGLRTLFLGLTVVFGLPACLEANENERSNTHDETSAWVTVEELQAWRRPPALLAVFETSESERIAIIGDSDEMREGGVYTGPLMTLVLSGEGKPIAFALTGARRSSYKIYSDDRYFAINSMVPDTILPAITVFDSSDKSLRTYDTDTVFLVDFAIWNGQLYHSTEKASPTLGRFDLETGEPFDYEGFNAQGPSLVVHDNQLYAVARNGTYEVSLDTITPSAVELPSAEKATRTLGRGTDTAELFDSWEELLAQFSTK